MDRPTRTYFCKYCFQLKSVNEFTKSNVNKCKSCHAEYCRQWKKNNRLRYNKYHRNYRADNPENKIKHALRTRLSNAINGNHISHTLLMNLGCGFDFFMKWLEYQFTPEMTWNNFGEYWHIDHVLPVCIFNHENLNEIKVCWNWANLRPLEAKENLSKKDTVDFNLYEMQLRRAEIFLMKHNFYFQKIKRMPTYLLFQCDVKIYLYQKPYNIEY